MLQQAAPVKDASFIPYIKLAFAIIEQAILDATTVDTLPPVNVSKHVLHDWNEARNDRQDAQQFLTTDSEDLEFVCRVAGIEIKRLLRHARANADNWPAFGRHYRSLKKNRLKQDKKEEESSPSDANP